MTTPNFIRINMLMLIGICLEFPLAAQQITGIWKGQINHKKVEVKIILNGDSLTGTSYYYGPGKEATRYSIKGYFDQETNAVVWWDDQLIEASRAGRLGLREQNPYMSTADFNCPGGARMMLDGRASKTDKPDQPLGRVALVKRESTDFPDEWDDMIDNYLVGTNYPNYIDSIEQLAFRQRLEVSKEVEMKTAHVEPVPTTRDIVFIPAPQVEEEPAIEIKPRIEVQPTRSLSIEEKFQERSKVLALEVPLIGDSVELRFYDNAEIDGDSISLFLNNSKIFEHVRLNGAAYTIRFAVNELKDRNELIMVAENLGSIPPNTSYMVAESGGKRYEARLESTEGSSAMIRLYKPLAAL